MGLHLPNLFVSLRSFSSFYPHSALVTYFILPADEGVKTADMET